MPQPFSKNVHWAERNSYDPFHWAFTIIDAEHRLVHEGLFYSVSVVETDIANGSNSTILFRSPAGAYPHMRVLNWSVTAGPVSGFIYEEPTVSDDGTAVTNIRNRNRASSSTHSVSLFTGPTVSDVGTELAQYFIPGSGSSGFFSTPGGVFGSAPGEEWVFKPSTDYLIRLVNNSGSAATINTQIAWYELDGYGQ